MSANGNGFLTNRVRGFTSRYKGWYSTAVAIGQCAPAAVIGPHRATAQRERWTPMRAVETFAVVVMLLGDDAREFPQTAGTLPESDRATVGYRSVEAALKALHQKPGVTFRSENGWLIADEDGARTIWSFAPTGTRPTRLWSNVLWSL